jgi:hypothetical protein
MQDKHNLGIREASCLCLWDHFKQRVCADFLVAVNIRLDADARNAVNLLLITLMESELDVRLAELQRRDGRIPARFPAGKGPTRRPPSRIGTRCISLAAHMHTIFVTHVPSGSWYETSCGDWPGGH